MPLRRDPVTVEGLTYIPFEEIKTNPVIEHRIPLNRVGSFSVQWDPPDPPDQILRVVLEAGVYRDLGGINIGPDPAESDAANRGPVELVGVPGETILEDVGLMMSGSTVRVSGVRFSNPRQIRQIQIDAIEAVTLEDVILDGYQLRGRRERINFQSSGPETTLTIQRSIIQDVGHVYIRPSSSQSRFKKIRLLDSWLIDIGSPTFLLYTGSIVELDNVRLITDSSEPDIFLRKRPDFLILGDPVFADRASAPTETTEIP